MDHPEIVDFINVEGARGEEGARAHRRRLPVRLQRRGLPHDQRPELEQLGPRHRRVHERARRAGGEWQTLVRTTGEVVRHLRGEGPLEQDRRGRVGAAPIPGVQYDTHDQPLAHLPEHRDASTRRNPCSEYMFLDDSACNLSSLNLTKFLARRTAAFDVEGYRHAMRDLLHRAGDPRRLLVATRRRTIAQNSHDYRPLGLGYANLGTLLMLHGHPVRLATRAARSAARSPRSCAATPTARRAEMAPRRAPFAGFAKNREPMLRVMGMHRDAAYAIDRDDVPARRSARAACEDWDEAVRARRAARLPQRAGDGARADRARSAS